MLFWVIGMLRGKHGMGRILFERQAVHDAGQRWCDESPTAAANGIGAWARGLDSCRLRHYGHMRAARLAGGPPLFLPSLASVLDSLQLEGLHAYEKLIVDDEDHRGEIEHDERREGCPHHPLPSLGPLLGDPAPD